MESAALVVIDAQQEYFAPLGKVVLPQGPAAAQIVKILLGDQLGGTPPPKTASVSAVVGRSQSITSESARPNIVA